MTPSEVATRAMPTPTPPSATPITHRGSVSRRTWVPSPLTSSRLNGEWPPRPAGRCRRLNVTASLVAPSLPHRHAPSVDIAPVRENFSGGTGRDNLGTGLAGLRVFSTGLEA